MPYHTWRSADYPQDYRPVSPTSQGLGCLRYYQEYLAQQRMRQPMDLPRYMDNWTRYSNYSPPSGPPRDRPWILQPCADRYRGPRRPVYVLYPPGQTPLRQARVRQMTGQRNDVSYASNDYEAADNIEPLATELSAMDSADASLYEIPTGDWKRVDLVDMINRL
jgi:hypothetical protein